MVSSRFYESYAKRKNKFQFVQIIERYEKLLEREKLAYPA
jgi:hypothetical protein